MGQGPGCPAFHCSHLVAQSACPVCCLGVHTLPQCSQGAVARRLVSSCLVHSCSLSLVFSRNHAPVSVHRGLQSLLWLGRASMGGAKPCTLPSSPALIPACSQPPLCSSLPMTMILNLHLCPDFPAQLMRFLTPPARALHLPHPPFTSYL